MDSVRGAVVVITGASSGIGRATALTFAREGARLVLAARREALLGEVAEECRELGGEAEVVPTDVTDAQAVLRLANRAMQLYGGIDVWVSNAGVGAVGRFEDTPLEAHRRVVETNLFGPLYSAHAVLPLFRRQGHGVLINTVSVGAWAPAPYAAAYAASKFAVRGFSETLRQELVEDPGIQVCTVLPGPIDTPLWQHGANYTGRAVKAMNPLRSPEEVADAILRLAETPRPELFVGAAGRSAALPHAVAPALAERVLAHRMDRDMFDNRPAHDTSGGVLEAMPDYREASGGWMERAAAQAPQGRADGRRAFCWTNLALFLLPIGLMSRLPAQVWERRAWGTSGVSSSAS